ncbi:MAG: TonB family protein [Steroidobacteraceae bacterium]
MRAVAPDLITQSTAALLTAAILWTVHSEYHRLRIQVATQGHEVRLSLMTEQTAPETPKPEPPRPKPPKPPQASAQKRIVAIPVPIETPAPVVSDAPAVADEAVVVTAEPPQPPAPGSNSSIEAAYAAALRQNVDARTSVPNSAEYRLIKPSGSALIRFVLDRVGNPSEVAVAHSSGSGILDRQALAIVSSGHYPPFPETAFSGELRHTFLVTIEFRS